MSLELDDAPVLAQASALRVCFFCTQAYNFLATSILGQKQIKEEALMKTCSASS